MFAVGCGDDGGWKQNTKIKIKKTMNWWKKDSRWGHCISFICRINPNHSFFLNFSLHPPSFPLFFFSPSLTTSFFNLREETLGGFNPLSHALRRRKKKVMLLKAVDYFQQLGQFVFSKQPEPGVTGQRNERRSHSAALFQVYFSLFFYPVAFWIVCRGMFAFVPGNAQEWKSFSGKRNQ